MIGRDAAFFIHGGVELIFVCTLERFAQVFHDGVPKTVSIDVVPIDDSDSFQPLFVQEIPCDGRALYGIAGRRAPQEVVVLNIGNDR